MERLVSRLAQLLRSVVYDKERFGCLRALRNTPLLAASGVILWASVLAHAASPGSDIRASELSVLALRFEEPLVSTTPTRREEDEALLEAISYGEQSAKDDFQVFESFLSAQIYWPVA
jgi:hypothetical protein